MKVRIILCHGLTLDSEESRTEAYTAFVTCLKYNQNYAPAYTSLGFFYADVANDPTRAYKCFQRAFELDAGEVDAAERLAQDFADTRQWELVEVVARRVLQHPANGFQRDENHLGLIVRWELQNWYFKPHETF